MNKVRRNARNLINAWKRRIWHRPAFVEFQDQMEDKSMVC
jgi:hypothetical protein